MNTTHPDIVVISPDGDYLIVIEVKANDNLSSRQNAIESLKHLMALMGCSVGLIVAGNHILLLRDSLEKSHGESIAVVGEASLPNDLLPAANDQWSEKYGLEFESRVQQWFEQLKQTPRLENLPDDLAELLSEPIISLIRLGEIRAAGPRWSRVAS